MSTEAPPRTTISDDELARLQREASERAAQNWDPREAALLTGPIKLPQRPKPETDDEMLCRLQAEAAARAIRNWDPTEAELLEGDIQPLASAVIGAIESVALDTYAGRRETPYQPGDYVDYLKTPHWKAMRARMLKRAGGYCQRCRRRRRPWELEVHHRDYRHLGAEREHDLEVLCTDCHAIEHLEDRLT